VETTLKEAKGEKQWNSSEKGGQKELIGNNAS
jgi:hypothetical protein